MPAPDYRRATGEPAVPSVTRGLPRWWLWLAFVIAIPVAIRVIAGEHAGAVGETWLYSLLLVPLFLSAAMLGITITAPFAKRGCFAASPWPDLYRLIVSVALGLGAYSLLM